MLDRFILLAITPITLASGALGWTSWGAEPIAAPITTSTAEFAANTADRSVNAHSGDNRAAEQTIVTRSADGLFRIVAMINGRRLHMIVDTGASTSILSRRDVALLTGVRVTPSSVGTMRTLGGDTRYRAARVASVEVGSQRINGANFAVFDTPDNISIIGQDVLRELGPIILDGDTLTLP